MFKKAILAFTVATTIAGAAVSLSAPAEAHSIEPIIPGHGWNHNWNNNWNHNWNHNWGDHWGYYNHPHFEGSYYAYNNCYFEIRTVRVDTPDGPVYEKRNVKFCN